MSIEGIVSVLADGTVYSKRNGFTPFSIPTLEEYTQVIGEEKMERLLRAAEKVKGTRLLELNATAQGGGVAELLYSYIPFVNLLGVDAEWRVLQGSPEFYKCTKQIHNILQGGQGTFTPEMENEYKCTMEQCCSINLMEGNPDVVIVHDPQPMGLAHLLKQPGQTWFWRCHIDIEDLTLRGNPGLRDFLTASSKYYDAAIFTAAHYVVSRWPLPKFIIPPFIDPLSEKNRELEDKEISAILGKHHIDANIPIIAQIGRFDPWKGIDRTIETFRRVHQQEKCQLIVAGGMATDDPEGERIFNQVLEGTYNDPDVHVLNLPLANRLENAREVNALQRAASVIMQPSMREGFGLVITEALWKGKPVISSNVGAISMQLRDGETGYFYKTTYSTARKVIHLLKNPELARSIGEQGRNYVREHFLMPDRVADWLMAINLSVNGMINKDVCDECITSFHPWYKLSKRPVSSSIV
jgi:trehalose synthase